MSKKQKIDAAKKAFAEQEALRLQNLENAKTERLSEDDCTFVQMDERLHDQKFEHEPISFYKDAWLRFKQNKASIVAAAIILVIVLMAIFAPVFSGTSYREQHTEFGVLPPRIPYLENLGIADGYTGLNMERPALQRMLKAVECKQVNIVLTKDLSRLGRNYLQTGYLIEDFFPRHGVRYIAINDGIDTMRESNDITPFKNILNEMYSKDISKKVHSSYLLKAQKGQFTGCLAPFGYRKNPADKNHLLVDPETAPIVRQIFAAFTLVFVPAIAPNSKIHGPPFFGRIERAKGIDHREPARRHAVGTLGADIDIGHMVKSRIFKPDIDQERFGICRLIEHRVMFVRNVELLLHPCDVLHRQLLRRIPGHKAVEIPVASADDAILRDLQQKRHFFRQLRAILRNPLGQRRGVVRLPAT